MRFFFVYEKEKLSHIIIWRSFSDEVHGEKDIKIGKLFTAKSLIRVRVIMFVGKEFWRLIILNKIRELKRRSWSFQGKCVLASGELGNKKMWYALKLS